MSLKQELLDVYRYLTSTTARMLKLEGANVELERKCASYEEEVHGLEHDLHTMRMLYRQCEAHNAELIEKVTAFERSNDVVLDLVGAVVDADADKSHDAVLDLVGAVLKEEADSDARHRLIMKAPASVAGQSGLDRVVIMAFMPANENGGPMHCLSCGGDLGDNYYLCEPCFEADMDQDRGIFDELKDAWECGDSDFPRPGKNARVNA
jgi:hypothetical protein